MRDDAAERPYSLAAFRVTVVPPDHFEWQPPHITDTKSCFPVPIVNEREPESSAGMNDAPQSLEPLLEMHRRDRASGLMDAPWPPVYPKQPDEPPRVAPSRARTDPSGLQ